MLDDGQTCLWTDHALGFRFPACIRACPACARPGRRPRLHAGPAARDRADRARRDEGRPVDPEGGGDLAAGGRTGARRSRHAGAHRREAVEPGRQRRRPGGGQPRRRRDARRVLRPALPVLPTHAALARGDDPEGSRPARRLQGHPRPRAGECHGKPGHPGRVAAGRLWPHAAGADDQPCPAQCRDDRADGAQPRPGTPTGLPRTWRAPASRSRSRPT